MNPTSPFMCQPEFMRSVPLHAATSIRARTRVARRLLPDRNMKTRRHTYQKRSLHIDKLPRGVIQRAANRVGLTRNSLMCVAGLLSAGFNVDSGER